MNIKLISVYSHDAIKQMYSKIALSILLCIFILSAQATNADFSIKYKNNILFFNIVSNSEVELAAENLDGENYSNIKTLEIPTEAYWIDVNYTVIGIGGNALANANKLEEVVFHNDSTIKYIGTGAFAHCTKLKRFTIPQTVSQINDLSFAWSGIDSVVIHNNITSIGNRSFTNCYNLKYVAMGKNVSKIGHQAFAYCSSLSEFTFPKHLKTIGYDVFIGSRNIESINYYTLDCKDFGSYFDQASQSIVSNLSRLPRLQTVIFNHGIKSIPSYLLYNCYAISESIDSIMPTSVDYIGELAFHNTPWQKNKIDDDILYVNNIAYAFVGDKDTLTEISLRPSTKSISPYCFSNCINLRKITFSGDEEYINYRAFNYCNSLKEINIPNSVNSIGDFAFANCDSLQSLNFATGNHSIGSYAFANCMQLDSINIPKSVRSIGIGAFYNCKGLYTAIIDAEIDAIPRGLFSKCKNLETAYFTANIDSILGYAFAGCEQLYEIKLKDNISYIGLKAFSHCHVLEYFDFGETPKVIKNYAFYRCYQLGSLNLTPAKSIGNHAFELCNNVYEIIFSDNLDTIGDWAFYELENISAITIPTSTKHIGTYAFAGAANLMRLNIEAKEANINRLAFAACYNLRKVSLNSGIKTIGSMCFANCYRLENISLPKSLNRVSDGLFKNCTSLKLVKLSTETTYIGSEAFFGCKRLVNVHNNQNIDTIASNAFMFCESMVSFPMKNRMRYIGTNAFRYTSLDDISIPDRVAHIGDNAFADCYNLNTINYNATKAYYSGNKKGAFANGSKNVEINFGKLVKSIPNYLFANVKIKQISIPNNIQSIGSHAFANNDSLKHVDYNPKFGVNVSNTAFMNTPWEATTIEANVVYLNNIALYLKNKNVNEVYLRAGTKSIASDFAANNNWLTTIHFPESLEIIGNNAFENCINLDSIILPSSLTHIYDNSFFGCKKIETLNFPNSLAYIGESAFAGCEKINLINFAKSNCHIGFGAFAGCSNLVSVKTSNSLQKIDGGAFAYCTSLSHFSNNDYESDDKNHEFILPEKIDSIKQSTFFGCNLPKQINLPLNLTYVGPHAFSGNNKTKSISFTWKLNHIDPSAFRDMKMLETLKSEQDNSSYFTDNNGILYSISDSAAICCPTRVNGTIALPNSIKIIKEYAFKNCYRITSIKLPKNLERIEHNAFDACKNITRIEIGTALNFIGEHVFDNCNTLSYIQIDKDNQHFSDYKGIVYNKDMTVLIKCPENMSGAIVIPKTVTEIKDYAFYNCKNLKYIKLHKNVKTIGDKAFIGAANVQK